MLNLEYMWGLLPVLLSYLPLTLQMAGIAMVLDVVTDAFLPSFTG